MADIVNLRISIENLVQGISNMVKALEAAESAMTRFEAAGTRSISLLVDGWRALRQEMDAAAAAAGKMGTRRRGRKASTPAAEAGAVEEATSPQASALRKEVVDILTRGSKAAAAAASEHAAAAEKAAAAEEKIGAAATKTAAAIEKKARATSKVSEALSQAQAAEERRAKGRKREGEEEDRKTSDFEVVFGNVQKQAMLVFRSFLLWETLRFVLSLIDEYTNRFIGLEAVLNRVGFAAEKSSEQVRAMLASQAITTARYGVSNADIAPASLFIAQAGIGKETQELAAKVARVFGANQYANVLEEIYQTQRRAASAGVEHLEVLDYLATAFGKIPVGVKMAGRELEVYFDALQYGIELSPKFGLSVEDSALAIARAASVTERSVQAVATSYSALAEKIGRDPTTKGYLSQLGIRYETTAEGLSKVIDAYQALRAAGDQEGIIRLLSAVLGGGLQSPGRLIEAKSLIEALSEFEADQNKLRSFEELSSGVANTFKAAFTEIQSSWDAMLTSMVLSVERSGIGEAVITMMRGVAGRLQTIGTGIAAKPILDQMSEAEIEKLAEEFKSKTGLSVDVTTASFYGIPTPVVRAAPTEAQIQEALTKKTVGGEEVGYLSRNILEYAFTKAAFGRESAEEYILRRFYEYALERASGGVAAPPGAAPSPAVGGLTMPEVAPEVENLLRLPEKTTVAQFMDAYLAELKKLEAIPNYYKDEERTITALINAQNEYIETQSLNSQAAAQALKLLEEQARKAAEAMSMFGGLRELPEGVTFEQFEAEVRRQEARIKEQIPEEYSGELLKQKDFFFDDDGKFRRLLASSEAIRLATQELVKIEKEKITGVFNVPDEGRVLVPFFALQQRFVPRDSVAPGVGATTSITGINRINAQLTTTSSGLSVLENSAVKTARALDAMEAQMLARMRSDYYRTTTTETWQSQKYADNPELRLVNMRERGFLSAPSAAFSGDVNVNVVLDGNVVQRTVHHYAYASLDKARRSSSAVLGGGRVHLAR